MNAPAFLARPASASGLTQRPAGVLRRANTALAEHRLWWLTVAAVLLLQAILVISHEGWTDEWQALLIAVTPTDLAGVLASLHYEGHPPLWYLLLRTVGSVLPLAAVLPATQLVLGLITQSLVLLKLRGSRLERLAIALSYFVLIEMGTVARGLSLGLVLLVAFFALSHRGLRWAAIILMPLVDLQFGLLSLVGLACLWREGERSRIGFALWLIASLLAAASIVPAPDVAVAMEITSYERSLVKTVTAFSALLAPLHLGSGWIAWPEAWPGPAGYILGCMYLVLGFVVFHKAPFERVVYHAFLAACVGFSIFVYPLGVRHLTLVPLLMILLVTRLRAGDAAHPVFHAWLALSAILGLAGAGAALAVPFDSSALAAQAIRDRGLQDRPWISWPDSVGIAVAGNLQRDLVSIEKGCTFSFHRWDRPQRFRPEAPGDDLRLRHALQGFVAAHGTAYIVTPIDLAPVLRSVPSRLIAHVPAGLSGYEFYLYQVPGKSPAAPQTELPRCQPMARAPLSAKA
jgi:hypothetical protein